MFYFLYNPVNVGSLISSSSSFSKPSLDIWKFLVHIMLKPSMQDFKHDLTSMGASLVAQTVKCLPAMWETWVRALGGEDPLEKEMASHSSTLAWKIPWTEEPGRLQSVRSQSRTQLSKITLCKYNALQFQVTWQALMICLQKRWRNLAEQEHLGGWVT